LPAAAEGAAGRENRNARRLGPLNVLTLLSAVDGSLLALAAGGQLRSLGGAVAIGLTVVAGAGSWLAAQHAFAGRPGRRDLVALSLLGLVTVAATLLSALLGTALGAAMALHVLPKAAGVVLFLVAAEVAGIRLPAPGRLPLPALGLAAGAVLEVAIRWTP
jgi:hypothetical protein